MQPCVCRMKKQNDMKYSNEIIINLPRSKVIELFNDPGNLVEWQKTLQSFQHLNGKPGEPGARSQLVYLNGKRRTELVETVISNNLPEEFSAVYETKGLSNQLKNYFFEMDEDKTKWISQAEMSISGIFLKIMSLLMPGMFSKQSRTFMEDFKTFAEGRT